MSKIVNFLAVPNFVLICVGLCDKLDEIGFWTRERDAQIQVNKYSTS